VELMRRWIVGVLTVALSLGTLWACGRKAAPSLPEGERLKIKQEGRGRTLSVYSPFSEVEGPGAEEGEALEEPTGPRERPAEEAPLPPREVEQPLSEEGFAPLDQGMPPSPGGPGERGF
jgi:hypothetical protein